ncbi:MAG TPA: hypothetical protein VN883_14615 [Myxococcales bacterium]|jgi:hypothetical protein|nr:hypothetical protein [Myxococcales bacterium]
MGPDGAVEEIGGFYATRVVMAKCREEANGRAVETVTREIRTIARNPPESPLRIEIDACMKLDRLVTEQGGGFSFWLDKGATADEARKTRTH